MKTVNNFIGVIVYKNYEENVLLSDFKNQNNINDLIKILNDDEDAVSFEIRDIRTKEVVKVFYVSRGTKKEVERLGVTFDAYKTPMYKYKEKITWTNKAGAFKTKKEAEQKRLLYNQRNYESITNVINGIINSHIN